MSDDRLRERSKVLIERYGHAAVLEITETVLNHCLEFRTPIVAAKYAEEDNGRAQRFRAIAAASEAAMERVRADASDEDILHEWKCRFLEELLEARS
jgi:hypothetical protein